MRNTFKQRKQEGFTIIEVLIVLAIAGLIMVVVFLAVPALQRSARNNALSSAANTTLASVSEYVSNNNGNLPADQTAAAVSGNSITIGATGSNQSTAKIGANTIVNFRIDNGATAITSSSAVGTAQLVKGTRATCNDNANGITGTTASTRAYVLLYVAESAGGPIVQCVAS